MARYFIDTDDGDARFHDTIGVELSGDQEARKAALAALPDMARQKLLDGDRRTFRTVARDVDGKPVYRATLTLSGGFD